MQTAHRIIKDQSAANQHRGKVWHGFIENIMEVNLMSEKTIRRKAWKQGYRLQRYRGEILVINLQYNAIVARCDTLEEVLEVLNIG